eukprot:EG_transcript_16330
MALREAIPFNAPVDVSLYPAYPVVVARPMDFGTILQRLEAGHYHRMSQWVTDMELVFQNCRTFNAEGSDIVRLADGLAAKFRSRLRRLRPGPPPPSGGKRSRGDRDGLHGPAEGAAAAAPPEPAAPPPKNKVRFPKALRQLLQAKPAVPSRHRRPPPLLAQPPRGEAGAPGADAELSILGFAAVSPMMVPWPKPDEDDSGVRRLPPAGLSELPIDLHADAWGSVYAESYAEPDPPLPLPASPPPPAAATRADP